MKLCRFCNLKPYHFPIIGNNGEYLHYYKCGRCGLMTGYYESQRDALTEWDEISSREY